MPACRSAPAPRRCVLAVEAAFAAEDPIPGDEFAFGRVRMRIDVPEAGTYKVTYPFGEETFTVDAPGIKAINTTLDTGTFSPDSGGPLKSRIGAFLEWDTGAPPGYVGDGATPHAVKGSPAGFNKFRVEKVGGGPVAETDQFVVSGKKWTGQIETPLDKRRVTYDGYRLEVLATSAPNATVTATYGADHQPAGRRRPGLLLSLDPGLADAEDGHDQGDAEREPGRLAGGQSHRHREHHRSDLRSGPEDADRGGKVQHVRHDRPVGCGRPEGGTVRRDHSDRLQGRDHRHRGSAGPCEGVVETQGLGTEDRQHHELQPGRSPGARQHARPAADRKLPVVAPDTTNTPINTNVVVNVLANDTDPDGLNPASIQISTPPTAAMGTIGLIDIAGIQVKPTTGYTGTITFEYTVADTKGNRRRRRRCPSKSSTRRSTSPRPSTGAVTGAGASAARPTPSPTTRSRPR